MTKRKKDMLSLAALLALLVLFFSHILFTGKIIRAPDIINEFYWGVKGMADWPFWDVFKVHIPGASWNPFVNSGATTEGGDVSGQFLLLQHFIFHFFPAPENVAWYIVSHLFIGAAGVYCYCRLIGTSRLAAFLGGLIFAVAPENASLINAGHVMKIATISFAPWAFYFFEKGFKTRRLIFFLTTGFVLAFQFFHTHWQIAYYTCLAIGVYGLLRTVGIIRRERKTGTHGIPRLVGLNLVVMLFFLSTVAISLAPLANWSQDTNRGVQSGANQGKGGLDREEAMSWSLPPEELGSFVIPGFFGLSRQEGGENPTNIHSYYWGRMVFTQTTDYMGLLPWLLLPLPLMFRRDRYTWLALAAVAGGIIFSMGKYTFIYQFLFDYFPGINRFRVPKMIMFIPVLGLGVLSARGIDLLLDEEVRKTRAFTRYVAGILALPLLLGIALIAEIAGKSAWIQAFNVALSQPTRYEQGDYLVGQRFANLVAETGIAMVVAALYGALIFARSRRWLSATVVSVALIALYLADVYRVNDKFMFLVDEPVKTRGVKSPAMEFLAKGSKEYRVLPMDDSDPMQYATNGIPVMFTSNPVQQRRWQEFLDTFSFTSAMPDILNVKYLLFRKEQYEKNGPALGSKYTPVFTSPDGGQVVLENRQVLPKGWLVPSVAVVNDPRQALGVLQNPAFDPRRLAIVESNPPLPLADMNSATPLPPQGVAVTTYEGERIVVKAQAPQNALLVLGEKYYKGWRATVDGKGVEIYPVDHVLRGVYLTPGEHRVEFLFDPLPFKIGKYLTFASFVLFAAMLGREAFIRRKSLPIAEAVMADEDVKAVKNARKAKNKKK
jgi:hypothetical protein